MKDEPTKGEEKEERREAMLSLFLSLETLFSKIPPFRNLHWF